MRIASEANALAAIPNEWTKITPGPTNYMGRDLTPICSGFPGTDPTFSFFVKGGYVNNLVVYFQGGGSLLECPNLHRVASLRSQYHQC